MFRTCAAAAVGCCLAITVLAPMTAPAVAAPAAQAVPAVSGVKAAGRGLSALSARKPPMGMLAAIQRDLGLNANQAQSRLLNESRLSPIATQLHERLGDRFAGSWLQGPIGQTLVVATTSRADAAQITAAGAEPLIVARSLAKLQAVKDKLTAARPALSAVSSTRYIDLKTNKVVISSSTPKATANSIKAADVAPAAVRVALSAERPRLLQASVPVIPQGYPPSVPPTDLVGGQAYYAGTATRCSVGFAVTKGTQKGFVSAGHCGAPGTATVGFNRLTQGSVRASTFPGDGDHSWVALNDAWTPRPEVGNDSGGIMHVYGSKEAIEGSSVCLAGSSLAGLDWHCGTITQREADVTYPEGVVEDVMRTSACAHLGNAGAAMLSIGQAQGIVSGGSSDCENGGVTYVQPINDILTAYGLTLVTFTKNEASTGSCNGYPNSTTGALKSGQTIYQPAGLSYRTSVTGTHYGCLEANISGDFDLYLQKQNGLTWSTVAISQTPSPFEELGYLGPPGVYRYLLISFKGAGPYLLGYTTPQPPSDLRVRGH
ncbi:alpha-lytic protease prodomain-containing protein [Streptosporangium longisporum]|uniref:Alpha-lytic protease prodomain-containing protein n=2 Tax=Streptosporangium longisporum TaxID=46187 RepID=A0ABN3Y492_9ACTN